MLAISAAANVLLLTAAVHFTRQPAGGGTAVRPANVATLREVVVCLEVTNLPVEVRFVTNRFHWRALESTNWAGFVANLRAVGCPERTIRDLVVADAARRCQARERELRLENKPFSLAGQAPDAVEKRHVVEQESFEGKTSDEVMQLLGVDWRPGDNDGLADFEGQALMRFIVGPVSDEQFEYTVHWMKRLQAGIKEIARKRNGILLEEDYNDLADLRDRWVRLLALHLSPGQLEEFQARTGAIENVVDDLHPDWVPISPSELRQLALATTEVFGWPRKLMDFDVGDSIGDSKGEREAKERLFMERAQAILGADKADELERVQDGEYRNLLSLTKNNHLDRSAALKVFEVRQAAQDELKRLREDRSLAEAERRQEAEAVANQTQSALRQILGPAAYGAYLNRGGQWVTNFLGKL